MNSQQSGLVTTTFVVVFAAAFGVMAFTDASSKTGAQRAPEAIAISGDSSYFPAQHVNQAKELEPHIQAF